MLEQNEGLDPTQRQREVFVDMPGSHHLFSISRSPCYRGRDSQVGKPRLGVECGAGGRGER